MNEFERGVLQALKGIDASLRALKGPGSPEEGIVAQEPTQDSKTPQEGAQWLTEDTPVDFAERAFKQARADWLRAVGSGSVEVSPRLVEKLLNPEGH